MAYTKITKPSVNISPLIDDVDFYIDDLDSPSDTIDGYTTSIYEKIEKPTGTILFSDTYYPFLETSYPFLVTNDPVQYNEITKPTL